MSKRPEYDFLGLYRALFRDVSVYLPVDRKEWERDMYRLSSLMSDRGQATFTLDLPALGKVLDRALADGRLSSANLNLYGKRSSRSKIPRLFWGLWSRLFDSYGCLKAVIDPNVVLFLRTLLYVGKNLEWECAPKYLFEATKEFYDVENEIPPQESFWDEDSVTHDHFDFGHLADRFRDYGSGDLFLNGDKRILPLLHHCQHIADRVARLIGVFNPETAKFRHGPGVVSDLRKGEYKYDFPYWNPRLERLFPYDLCGKPAYGVVGLPERWDGSANSASGGGLDVQYAEFASKLIAVPKTAKGPRLIAAEPSSNQWVQQGIRVFLAGRVADTCLRGALDFTDQESSRQASRSGSRSGLVATIDLKSASDRLSCWLVQRLFRANRGLLEAFAACRTRYISNDIDAKMPKLHKLRKFATQGSALTFPVQSISFLMLCLGVGSYLHPRWKLEELCERVQVFGDDLIVPVEWEPLVEGLLELLYLRVNQTKTFKEGNFRESCGMDAWDGYDVTPPHVTMRAQESAPRTIASVVAVSNNFYSKGFWHAASWIRKTVPHQDRILVVGRSSGIFGFISNMGAPIPKKVRWGKRYHCHEAEALLVIAKSSTLKQETEGALLQYFTEEPDPRMNYSSGLALAGTPVFKRTWVPIEALH